MYADPRLAGSWTDLIDRLDRQASLTRWAQLEPALAPLEHPQELTALLARGAPAQRADDLLGALVRLAAADGHDDGDAVLLLLHLLSDGALALAARLRDLPGDVLVQVVAQLTVQIRAFPWRRRQRAFAANLLLDTKTVLMRELKPHWVRRHPNAGEVLVDPTDRRGGALLERTTVQDAGDELELLDVLVWAERTGVVAAEDVALLMAVERSRQNGGPAQLRVAAAWGINERTLRRRRDRTLTALRTARGSYLAACG